MNATWALPSVMDPSMAPLASMYASACLDTVEQDDIAKELADEIDQLVSLIDQIPSADILLVGAIIDRKQRQELVDRVFAGRVSKSLEAFLGVLASRDRLGLLWHMAPAFRSCLNERMGLVEVDVTTAVALDAQQLDEISSSLGASLDVPVTVNTTVDESLVGGMIIRIGDRVYDASIATSLNNTISRSVSRMVGGRKKDVQ